MNRKTALCVFAGIVMVGFFAMADAGFAAKPGFDDHEIRIAQFSPQTGSAAAWGAVARGGKFLFDLVNEEGGIHGRKINYFLRDAQYNPSQAMAAVRELVDRQGVFAFTGGVSGAGCIAVKDYLDSNKVLWVVPGSAALNPVKYPPSRYRFHAYPLFQDEASIVTKYAVEKLGYKKIGFLYQDDVFGKSGLSGCKQRLATYGMDLVAELPAEPTSLDVTSQMLRFQQAGAEAVLMWVNPSIAVATLKTCANIGYKPQWIAFDGLSDYPLMHHITDGLFEGVITTAFIPPPDSDDPLVVKYREAAKRLAPQERWSYLFMGGIWFAEALVEALKRVGRDLSTEAVISELNKFENWKALGPPITWNESRRQGTDAVQIARCGPGGSHELLQDWTSNDLATWKKK
jgi:ABC-type branched-subunit amino acid transport system substrate-binding protein